MHYLERLLDHEATIDTPNTTCRRERAGHNFCEEFHTCWSCSKLFRAIEQCQTCLWYICQHCRSCGCTLAEQDSRTHQLLEGLAQRFCYPEVTPEFLKQKTEILRAAYHIVVGKQQYIVDCPRESYHVYVNAYIEAPPEMRHVIMAMAKTFLACAQAEDRMLLR